MRKDLLFWMRSETALISHPHNFDQIMAVMGILAAMTLLVALVQGITLEAIFLGKMS
jgi:hypothetical protein